MSVCCSAKAIFAFAASALARFCLAVLAVPESLLLWWVVAFDLKDFINVVSERDTQKSLILLMDVSTRFCRLEYISLRASISLMLSCRAGSQKLHIDVGLSTVPFVRHIYSLLECHQCVNVHRSLTNVLNKGFTFNPEWLKCFDMLLSLWYVKFCPSFCETTDTWCKITVLAQDLFSWLINFTWIHFSHFTQSVPLLDK